LLKKDFVLPKKEIKRILNRLDKIPWADLKKIQAILEANQEYQSKMLEKLGEYNPNILNELDLILKA